MASDKKTFEKVVSGSGTVGFRDLERLLELSPKVGDGLIF